MNLPRFRLAVRPRPNDRRRPTLPLRLVLITLFVLLTVGTVGFVETLFFLNGQQAAQDLANRLMDDVSGRVGLYLDTYLQTPQLVNRLNADAVALGELDLQDLPALERHLFTQLMQFESLSSIQAGNRQNDFRMVTRQDGLRLLQADSANPTQMQEYALDGGGVKSDLLSASSATTVRNQLWYQTALFLEKPTWGVISQSSTGDVSLTATRPVFDAQRQVSGVFSAAIFLNAINTFLSQLQLAKYGKVFILEPNGWIVSTSDQKWSESGSPFQRFNLVDSPDPVAQMAGRSLIQQFGDFSRIDRPQQLVFSQQGDRHFLQVMPFRDEYGLNWLTVVTVPEAEFLGQIHLSTRSILMICAIALLVSILLGLWMARAISRPIQQLSRASHALAEGEWREPLLAESPFTEVQVLAKAFNRMARQLQDYFDQAATALKASEEKFAKMFHNTPDPIAIATEEGHYLEVNDAFVEVFGYSRAEVIGRKVSEVELWVHPEERKHYVRSIEALGRISNQEYMFRKKTGEVLTALFSTEIINIGEQKCFIGIAKEISDRKRIEANLRQSEAALREAQRIAHIGSWEYDPQTHALTGSEELFRICGLIPKPFLSLDEVSQAIHSDDRCTHQQLISAAVAEGKIYKDDMRILHLDGSVRHVELRGEPIFDAEGNLIRIVGTALDITDRKQIEDALRQSEQLFRGAFASSAFGISIRSMTGRYLQVNSALCKMLGYTEAELLNLTYRDITHPDDLAIDPSNTIRKLITGELDCYELEKRFLHKEGQTIWGLISMSIVRDLEQQPLYFVTQVQNISDRKQIEERLQQSEATKEQILKSIPDLIIWMASDGTCLNLIDGSMGSDLYVGSEAVGKNLYDLLPSEMAQARAIAVQQALETSEVQIYEQQLMVRGNLQYEEVRVVSVGGDRFLVIVRDITQRKLSEIQRQRAEAELEIQRSFFRQVIDVMPSSVFVKDLEGRFLLANQVVSESYGCSIEEIVGKREADFNPNATPEQLEHSFASNWEVITSGQPKQTLPYQIVKATGEQRWVQTLLRPLVGAQGQSQGIVGNTIDVTDLKQAEADLRRQIRRSQLFSDIALKIRQSFQFEEILQTTVTEVQTFLQVDRVMLFQFQGDGSGKVVQEAIVPGNLTTLNQVFADICFPEAFVDRYRQGRIRDVDDIETLDIDPCHLNFLRSLGVRAKLIIPIFVGSWLWGLLIAHHCQPRTWSDFEIDLLQELANQAGIVLAQSQLLVAQKESEERFRSAFDAAPIGIALVGLDERWIKINPVLCAMLGYPESALLGRNAFALIHPEDTQKFRRCVEQCVEQSAEQTLADDNYTAQAELRYCCSGGRVAWALLSLSTVRGAQNQPLYYVSQIQDITERHALDQMKTEFISIISHELRTPLTAMRGSLGLIATGVYDRKPEKAKRMIEIAVNNSDRLVRLVNDILDLERLSSDKVQLMQERCCVAELLQRASEGLQAIADDASVAIVTEMESDRPSRVQVWGEPDAIIQTLTNLISNAIKFSPPHTIVRLSAHSQIDSVLFQVKDQGRGIPLDKLEAIFERFQQVDVSDSRQKGGTGLGLAICRKIVQRHGGEIWVESTVGEGSSFYFTLPIPPGEQP